MFWLLLFQFGVEKTYVYTLPLLSWKPYPIWDHKFIPVFRSKWLKNHTLWGVTYLSLNWCKLWPIVIRPLAYRYIDRASTDTGRCIDRNLIGSLLVAYRSPVGPVSVDSRAMVDRYILSTFNQRTSTDTSQIFHWHIVATWSTDLEEEHQLSLSQSTPCWNFNRKSRFVAHNYFSFTPLSPRVPVTRVTKTKQ